MVLGGNNHGHHHVGGASIISGTADRDRVLGLMKQDYTYPKPGDPEFQSKIYEKREFNFHKIPTREHIRTYDDVRMYRDKHCTSNSALYSHQNFLANMFNPDTPYKGLLVQHGLGSGKCTHGSTRVYANGTLMRIDEIYKRFIATQSPYMTDEEGGEWYRVKGNVYTNSINEKTGKIVQTRVSKIYRQRIDEDVATVTLANGLKMTMTKKHRLLTRRGWKRFNEYREGSYVALPRKLIHCQEARAKDPAVTDELTRLLAWQISEGHEYKGSRGYFQVTQNDRSVLESLQSDMRRVEDSHALEFRDKIPDYDERRLNVIAPDYQQFLEKHGYTWGNLSAKKRFPDFIMRAADSHVRLFIRAYMDAEAHFSHNHGVIEMSTASREVSLQMHTLLKRFGINSRILTKRKCATNGTRIMRTYYEVHVSGPDLRMYRREIGFGVDYKQEGLEDVCDNRDCNTNTDILPMHAELAKLRRLTNLPMNHITNKANFNGTTNPSVSEAHNIRDRLQEMLDKGCDHPDWLKIEKQYRPDTQKLRYVRGFKSFLDDQLEKEVCYVPIKSIETHRHNDYVYDLEILEHHNYVAEGMICHNTIGAISVAEQFKSLVAKYGTKIHVLLPGPVIREVWKEQLLKGTKETYMKYHDRNSILDEAEYARMKKMALNNAMQFYRFMSYRSFSKRVLGERVIDKQRLAAQEVAGKDGGAGRAAGSKYRKTEKGEYERDVPVDKIHNLDNTLIVVDEAHNLTGNDYGEALKEIIKRSKNCRVILLTATPMKNLADDIVELLNFIRPQDSPIERDKIFTSDSGHQMRLRPEGLNYLKRMSQGYISYLRGADPLVFAKRVDVGHVPEGLKFTKVVSSRMYPFQRECYNEAIRDEGDALSKKSEAVANFVVPGLSPDKKSVVGYYGREGIQLVCNQLKTHAAQLNSKIAERMAEWIRTVPEGKRLKDAEIRELLEGNGRDRDEWIRLAENGKTITGRILKMPFLRIFSTKFADAVDGLAQRVEGKRGAMTSFCYSNLVKAGIELFQEVLGQNGYLEYDENGTYQISGTTICHRCGIQNSQHDKQLHPFRPATFVTVTGKASDDVADYIPEEKQRVIRTVFNPIDNLDGKHIKCVLGSRVMNEGVSLENLGEIDLLDVYFNFGRVDQVVGRGIRNCSHYQTINDMNRYPEVKVYKFCITLDGERDEAGKLVLSSEEELYQKAELKYLLIKTVERALKEVAVDCALNRNGNIFPSEAEEHRGCSARGDCPAICDYMECDYKCDDETLNAKWFDKKRGTYRNVPKDQLDYSTFSHRLSRDEINFAKDRIKELYRLNSQYKLKDLVSYVKESYTDEQHRELFTESFVYRALDELLPKTENDFNNFKDTVLDGWGRSGYLISRGLFYIFQPFDQPESVPMYYRTAYYGDMHNRVSLHAYMRQTVDWSKIDAKMAVGADAEDRDEAEKAGAKNGLNFEATREYYENRPENDFVIGTIDLDMGRRKLVTEETDFIFKIRPKREAILDKKRGTGIYSAHGSTCTSKGKPYLEDVAEKLGVAFKRNDPDVSRAFLCNAIKEKLLERERYSTDNKTYMIIPIDAGLPFPLNLRDRAQSYVDRIKSISKATQTRIEHDRAERDTGYVRRYRIHVKPHGAEVEAVIRELGGTKHNAEWVIAVE
jgi:intein/homing endonuclease/DNA polymerase III delta prime subunit